MDAVADASARTLLIGGKDLRMVLGAKVFREMVIVNRIRNLHNLWFVSNMNTDQIIIYIKLFLSILTNKVMFIKFVLI